MNSITHETNSRRVRKSGSAIWRRVRSNLVIVGPWLTLAVIITWVLTFFRVAPVPNGDYGIAVSVSERLIAGDLLYSQVWDNRDPLYYWVLALFRLPGPLGGNLLEFLWFLVAAVGAFYSSKALGAHLRTRVAISGVAVPIILAGTTYVPGSTHLGAISLGLVAAGLILNNHYFWAGAVLPLVFFFKILVFPVSVSLLVLIFLSSPSWSRFVKLLLGSLSGATLIVGILVFRSELFPYLNSLRLNVSYSQTASSGEVQSNYVSNLVAVLSLSTQITIGSIVLALLVSLMILKSKPLLVEKRTISFTIYGVLASTVAALFVVALTGKWWHHGQVFVLPAVMSAILVLVLSQKVTAKSGYLTPICIVVTSFFFAGMPWVGSYVQSLEYARSNVSAQLRFAPMTEEMRKLSEPSNYARVGQGSEFGHAFGLGQWQLNCPRFHQLPWESKEILDITLNCLSGSNVIAIDNSAIEIEGIPVWNGFIESMETLIAAEYDCVVFSFGRLCEKANQ